MIASGRRQGVILRAGGGGGLAKKAAKQKGEAGEVCKTLPRLESLHAIPVVQRTFATTSKFDLYYLESVRLQQIA